MFWCCYRRRLFLKLTLAPLKKDRNVSTFLCNCTVSKFEIFFKDTGASFSLSLSLSLSLSRFFLHPSPPHPPLFVRVPVSHPHLLVTDHNIIKIHLTRDHDDPSRKQRPFVFHATEVNDVKNKIKHKIACMRQNVLKRTHLLQQIHRFDQQSVNKFSCSRSAKSGHPRFNNLSADLLIYNRSGNSLTDYPNYPPGTEAHHSRRSHVSATPQKLTHCNVCSRRMHFTVSRPNTPSSSLVFLFSYHLYSNKMLPETVVNSTTQ